PHSQHQTPPEFPTLPLFLFPNHLRPQASRRAASLPAGRVPASRNFPSFPAVESAAAQSAPALSRKDTPAIRSHSKTSHQTHRHSARHCVPREYPRATPREFQIASTHGQSSAAPGHKTLPCPAPAALSTNRELQVCIGQTFLQIGSRAQAVPTRPIVQASESLRPA